ncbi:28221_t:CDS:1, partial [Gigaspora margarita]
INYRRGTSNSPYNIGTYSAIQKLAPYKSLIPKLNIINNNGSV